VFAVFIAQRLGQTIAYRGHQGIGGAQVNTRRQTSLVWGSGLTGFADL